MRENGGVGSKVLGQVSSFKELLPPPVKVSASGVLSKCPIPGCEFRKVPSVPSEYSEAV